MGFRKRLRKALRAAWSRENGRYPDGPVNPMTLELSRGSVVGGGMVLAHRRMQLKRQANKAIPSAHHSTRQQRRAQERAAAKHFRSEMKAAARRGKVKGGAAAIR